MSSPDSISPLTDRKSWRFSTFSFGPGPSILLDPRSTSSQPLLQKGANDPPAEQSTSSQPFSQAVTNNSLEKPIPLQSKKRQLWLTIILFTTTFPFSGLLFYYLIQVLTENNPNVGRLLLSPSTTLLFVTVLSQTLVMLNHILMNRVLDVLRWQLASRPTGVKAPIFFVLGSSISFFGALAILGVGGKTTMWSLHKLLTPILFLFTNVILKARITYPQVYTAQNTTQMFSGLAPLNTSILLQAHIVETAVICTYFSGYIASILSIPKFVTEANPLACSGSECTSIFLPGGVEQMRLLNTNFSGTLLQGEFLNGSDAITSYNTPGYQLDFWPTTDFEFDRVRDCTLYGTLSRQGLYMCVATDENQHLAIGWSACPTAWYNDDACISNTTWTETLQQNIMIAGWKRYAEVTYDSKNLSILDADMGSRTEAVDYNASDFRLAYDTVLDDNATSGSSTDLYMVESLLYQLGWVLRLYMDDFPADIKTPTDFLMSMVVIPIQFSTAAWQKINASIAEIFPQSTLYALPSDLVTTVSTVRRTARVMAVPWSVYGFVGVMGAVFLYTCALFVWIMWKGEEIPHISDFPELDFASKITKPYLEMQDLNSNAVPGSNPSSNSKYLETVGISNGTSSALIERFRDKTIKVVVKPGEKKSIVILTSDLEGDGEPLVIGWPYY